LRLHLHRICLLALVCLLCACSPRALLLQAAADELALQGAGAEDDLALARDAAAFHLKLSESVLLQTPGHAALATAVAAGFTQYAYAFVAFEADRLEMQDSRGAQRLRQRAARLYWRAQGHALAALEAQQPGFQQALAAGTARLQPRHASLAYWGAAAWGAAISLSKDQPERVADLPLASALATLAWQAEPGLGEGALAALMGSFEAARPGGSASAAQHYFDRAEQLAAGRNAGVYVTRAETLALPAGDRAAFESLLQRALQAADAQRDLANEVMRERATWLLATADDRF
jgi:predicted anti-sigma-YlaC factor YlaD